MNLSKNQYLLQKIDTNIELIKEDIVNIGITLNRDPIYFQETLDYGGNKYLNRQDYTSTPIVGTWENNFDNKAYITEFTFTYPSDPSNEPASTEMYHSTSFITKIGRYDGTGVSGFSSPYFEMSSNAEQLSFANSRNNNFSDSPIYYRHSYVEAPIVVDIGVSFGHLIQGDFSNTLHYLGNPVGTIKGYTY